MPTLEDNKDRISYVKRKEWAPFYSGGPIMSGMDDEFFYCCCGDKLNVVSCETGQIERSINANEDNISCFVIVPDMKSLITAHRSLLLKQWDLETFECVRTWRSNHTSPIMTMSCDQTATLLATGGSDGSVKIYDLVNKYLTHNLRLPDNVVTAIQFHPIQKNLVVTAAGDYNITIWDLNTSRTVKILKGHVSAIMSLEFFGNNILLSGGKDKIVRIWSGFKNVENMSEDKSKTIPIYDSIEKITLDPTQDKDTVKFIVSGGSGDLTLWDGTTSTPLLKREEKLSDKLEIGLIHTHALFKRREFINSFSDHSIEFVCMDTFKVKKRLAGHIDEVTGVHLVGKNSEYVAVITNSSNIKLFNRETSTYQLLKGHSDYVTDIAVFKDKMGFVSGAKDGSVCIWFVDSETGSIVLGVDSKAHNSSLTAVAMSQVKSNFFLTGSEDTTIKYWRCVKLKKGGHKLKNDHTAAGHDKTINSMHVSSNDELAVTGSEDRLVKLWKLPELDCVQTFSGHKRGVWCVRFSTVDKVVGSCSADGTIKVWTVESGVCHQTIDAHDCSIFSLAYLKQGTQIVSSGSDGLIKFWDVKTSASILTMDVHEENVYGLSVDGDGSTVITGSSDGTFVEWKETTAEVSAEKLKEYEEHLQDQQELKNLLQEKQIVKAFKLAIRLEQPATVLQILKELKCDVGYLVKTLGVMPLPKAAVLFGFVAAWNTNSRHSAEAQLLLKYLLCTYDSEDIRTSYDTISKTPGLIAYSERHYKRLSKMVQQRSFLDYTLHQMYKHEVMR